MHDPGNPFPGHKDSESRIAELDVGLGATVKCRRMNRRELQGRVFVSDLTPALSGLSRLIGQAHQDDQLAVEALDIQVKTHGIVGDDID